MSDTSLVFNIIGRDNGANSLISRTASNVRAANAISAASSLALGAAAVSAGANLLALGSAAAQMVGLVGLIPGVALGAAAGLAVLRLATLNIGAALKTSTGGGAKAAVDLADAEHRVETAQRHVIETQKALNDARVQAAKDIDDVNRSLTRSKLDEEEATKGVEDALKALERAKRGGNVSAIKDADLAYREALATLDEAKARTSDLQDQQKEQSQKGVEGSDAVQRALQAQKDAVYELEAAQRALNKARQGSGGGGVDPAAQAFAKLSPEAQKLVLAIRQLTPAWQGFQRTVQDAALRGAAGDFRTLTAVYLPILRAQLGGLAGAFNTAMHEAVKFGTSAQGSRDLNTALSNVVASARTLARAVQPVLSAFSSIGAVGSQFLPGLAADVGRLAERFGAFIAAARQSGQLQAFFGRAVVTARQFLAIAYNVGSAVVAIFRAGGAEQGQGMITWLVTATARMSAFLNSAQGQEKISTGLAKLREIVGTVAQALPALVQNGGGVRDTFSVAGTVVCFLADHLNTLAKALPAIAAGFVIYKASQVGANVAEVARLPILTMQAVSHLILSRALKAHTAAMRENMAATVTSTTVTEANTAATNIGTLAKLKNVAQTILLKAAEVAGIVVRGIATAAQWALNVAMDANPLGIIILLLALLVGAIIYAYKHSETFRKIVQAAWAGIKAAALAVWHWLSGTLWPGIKKVWDYIADSVTSVCLWIHSKFQAVINFFSSIPGNIGKIASRMWDGVKNAFKGLVNYMIGLWNRLDFGFSISIPDWIPGIGGKRFSIPDLIPDLPYLAKGGYATAAGMAMVGENGPERVFLPEGATVRPLERGGSGGACVIEIRSGGSKLDNLLVEILREAIRSKGGNVIKVLSAP